VREPVADLMATAWAEPPTVVIDEARVERVQARVTDTGRRLLERAVAEADDLFLYLEDDLAFNRSLRWKLEHWAPVTARGAGDPFVASLYNPKVPPRSGTTARAWCSTARSAARGAARATRP